MGVGNVVETLEVESQSSRKGRPIRSPSALKYSDCCVGRYTRACMTLTGGLSVVCFVRNVCMGCVPPAGAGACPKIVRWRSRLGAGAWRGRL